MLFEGLENMARSGLLFKVFGNPVKYIAQSAARAGFCRPPCS